MICICSQTPSQECSVQLFSVTRGRVFVVQRFLLNKSVCLSQSYFSSNNLFQNNHTKTYPGHIWCEHTCRHLVVVCAGDCLSQRPINGGGELAPRGALERHPPDSLPEVRDARLHFLFFSSSFSLLSFFSNFISSSPLFSSPVFLVGVAALFSLFLDHLSFK